MGWKSDKGGFISAISIAVIPKDQTSHYIFQLIPKNKSINK